jgi:hypothetical protein
MEVGMYEIVEKIWHGVSFIAVGGAVALIFFFVFAPSILGSKTVHKQLEDLGKQIEETNEQLKQIAGHLKKENDNRKKRT